MLQNIDNIKFSEHIVGKTSAKIVLSLDKNQLL